VFAVYVAVIYFMFLISICVLGILVTVVVQYLYLCSESKPLTGMSMWVSRNSCVCQIYLHRNTSAYINTIIIVVSIDRFRLIITALSRVSSVHLILIKMLKLTSFWFGTVRSYE